LRLTNETATKVVAAAIVSLGLTVMLGWHVGSPRIVQMHTAFAPMQFNTALCFCLAGIATMFACTRRGVAMTLAAVVLAVGVVTLLEYALGRNFGIDELLMRAIITVKTSHPGRMAPQTAVGFMLAGVALATLALGRVSPRRKVFVDVLGSLVGGLGLAALLGYCVGIEPAYGWEDFTRMALHAACGFVLLAFAILQTAWRLSSAAEWRGPQVPAIPVGIAALAVTLPLARGLFISQTERIDEATTQSVERAATLLEERLRGYVQSFGALADAWGRSGGEPQRTWEPDVARFLRDHPVFLAVSRGAPDGKFDWIFPVEPFPDYIGFDYSMDARRSAFLARARERAGPVLTAPLALKSGRPGILLMAPLLPSNQERTPFVVAAALLEDLFRPSALALPAYSLAVFEGENLLYGSAAQRGTQARAHEVHIDGASFRLEATPLPETIAAARSSLPMLVLGSGLLASVLLALTVQLAQVSSRRATELAAANRLLTAKKMQLERLALFDELTGLGNRNLLLMELDKGLVVARRDSLSLPLLLLDLNGFKAINDSFGHEAGDEVLREFGARLMEALPLSAGAFRTGGDEFAVLAQPGTSLEDAVAIAREIERVTQAPLLVGSEPRVIRASIGIAVYPRHGEERARLLRTADVAMYQAKHTSTGIQVASDEQPTAVLRALKQGHAASVKQ
jgi:diguanylate cyclase (GGDEF)-like protein